MVGAERRDLRQRQVHEDDAALDDVHAEVGVDARSRIRLATNGAARNARIVCRGPRYLAPALLDGRDDAG